jgi:DNA-binding transcriptional LysR family regulator
MVIASGKRDNLQKGRYIMELRQLSYVIQIAMEKNFSRAAEKLHIAQPSLSQQLSKLEQELGVKLFRRTTNSVELTQAGQVFVDKSQAILDAVEQLKQEMDDMAQMRRGRLVVGTLPITGSHILPFVLPAFGVQYPQIEVVLVEDTTAKLEQLTASGGTDLSLLSLPLIDGNLLWKRKYVWPYRPSISSPSATTPLRLPSCGMKRLSGSSAVKAFGKLQWIYASKRASRRKSGSRAAIWRRFSRWSPPAWASPLSRKC